MTAVSWVRADLDQLPGYVPGKRADGAERVVHARLASNESPLAPLPSVQAALAAEILGANRYPDMGSTGLIADLAGLFGVDADRIAVGNGSSSLIRDLVATVAGPGDEVVFATPSFPYYGNAAIIAGATPVPVPLDHAFRHDLDALADAVTERTRLLFVCNPNNPTGTTVTRGEIAAFLERVPERVLVIVDEAYIEFCADGASAIPLMEAHRNLGVLRTFSKAYGLASLRIGYLIAPSAVISFVRRVTVPFTVNSFAQAAARASLTEAAQSELGERVDAVKRDRDALLERLAELRMPVVPSDANFVFLPLGEASQEYARLCETEGVLVRVAGGGVRVTVGDPRENEHVLRTVDAWMSATQTVGAS